MWKTSLLPGFVVEVMTAAQAKTRTAKLRAIGARFSQRPYSQGLVAVEYPQALVERVSHNMVGAARHRARAQIGE